MRAHSQSAFTLIELMVATGILAIVALMSWRGIDAMVRAQQHTAQRSQSLLALQTALAQWRADLDATLPQSAALPGGGVFDYNGRSLRLLRLGQDAASADAGLLVVAWTQRAHCAAAPQDAPRAAEAGPCWMRWQSAQLRTLGQVQSAWQQAALWALQDGSEGAGQAMEQRIAPLARWQVLIYRDHIWQNAAPAAPQPHAPLAAMPEGVRLQLSLPEGAAMPATLTADWMRATVVRERN